MTLLDQQGVLWFVLSCLRLVDAALDQHHQQPLLQDVDADLGVDIEITILCWVQGDCHPTSIA